MDIISVIGGIIILGAHLPLFVSLYKKQVRLNIATWLLWSVIDTTALVVSVMAGAVAPTMIMAFAVAAWTVFFLILRSREWSWSKNETESSVLVIISLAVWFTIGSVWALVALVFGKYVAAAIPTYAHAYLQPQKFQAYIWSAFALGALLNVVGLFSVLGAWNITDFLYPTVGFFANGLIAILHLNIQKK